MIRYDLHLHTRASDGFYIPSEVCRIAKERGLLGISITDHDTVDAYSNLPFDPEILVIPGIEINTDYLGEEIHILGYYIDINHQPLLKRLQEIRSLRDRRCREIVEKVHELGIPLTWEQVLTCVGEGTPSRAHIGQALVQEGIVTSVEEAMLQYIGRGCPAYVERYHITPMEAIGMIREANGIPVLAHPGLIHSKKVILEVIEIGIDGIEVYHPKHSQLQESMFLALAKEYGLLVTGGSDFHGFADSRHAEFPGGSGLTEEKYAEFFYERKRIVDKNVE